jgi:hypothetical protein
MVVLIKLMMTPRLFDRPHAIHITTPTGHHDLSRAAGPPWQFRKVSGSIKIHHFYVLTRTSCGRNVRRGEHFSIPTTSIGDPAMFAQVIQGKTSKPEELDAALNRWLKDLAPDASGWLGSTSGVTEDGRAIAVVRFESEEDARRNSNRPEQDQWWSETAKLFDGEATFRDSTDVTVDVQGDPDQASFVQVMQGRSSDPERAKQLMDQDADKWSAFRPDVVGSVSLGHEGGAYTMVMYFTSEAEAREGERKEPPPELQAQMEEMGKLSVGETEFFDLKQPRIVSPT